MSKAERDARYYAANKDRIIEEKLELYRQCRESKSCWRCGKLAGNMSLAYCDECHLKRLKKGVLK